MKILLSCPHFPAFFNAAPRFWPAVEGFCRKPGPLVLPAASPTASLAQPGCGNLWLQTGMGLFHARRMVVRNKRLLVLKLFPSFSYSSIGLTTHILLAVSFP